MSKKIEKISKSNPTIISSDLIIEGEVRSEGLIEIEGTVNGIVKGRSVIIREKGSITGELVCDILQLKGRLEGEVSSKSISIFSKGYLKGNIGYETLSVEDGALIDGQFTKINPDSPKNIDNSIFRPSPSPHLKTQCIHITIWQEK